MILNVAKIILVFVYLAVIVIVYTAVVSFIREFGQMIIDKIGKWKKGVR